MNINTPRTKQTNAYRELANNWDKRGLPVPSEHVVSSQFKAVVQADPSSGVRDNLAGPWVEVKGREMSHDPLALGGFDDLRESGL